MTTGHREGWTPLLEELQRRRAAGGAMGGAQKVARYTASGRAHARQRIELLLDRDTFTELRPASGSGSCYRPEQVRSSRCGRWI